MRRPNYGAYRPRRDPHDPKREEPDVYRSRYDSFEQDAAYRRSESEHKANWDALHEQSTSFDDFASRAFLTQALAMLRSGARRTTRAE
jgi:hypothetical protein